VDLKKFGKEAMGVELFAFNDIVCYTPWINMNSGPSSPEHQPFGDQKSSRRTFLKRGIATAGGVAGSVVTIYELFTQAIPWVVGKAKEALTHIEIPTVNPQPQDTPTRPQNTPETKSQNTVDPFPETAAIMENITGVSNWVKSTIPTNIYFSREVNTNNPLNRLVSQIQIPNGEGYFIVVYQKPGAEDYYEARAVGASTGKNVHFPDAFDNIAGFMVTNLLYSIIDNSSNNIDSGFGRFGQAQSVHISNGGTKVEEGPWTPIDSLIPSFV